MFWIIANITLAVLGIIATVVGIICWIKNPVPPIELPEPKDPVIEHLEHPKIEVPEKPKFDICVTKDIINILL